MTNGWHRTHAVSSSSPDNEEAPQQQQPQAGQQQQHHQHQQPPVGPGHAPPRIPASQLAGNYEPEVPVAAPDETATPPGIHQTLGLPDTGEMEMLEESFGRRGGGEGEGGREIGGMSVFYRSPSDTKGVFDPFVFRSKAEGGGAGQSGREEGRVIRKGAGEPMPSPMQEDGWAALMTGLGW